MTKILVVEDENNIRETLVDILEMNNYEVLEAENGIPGSEMAIKEKPDLIFCDIDMPEMNGFDMLTKLRKDYNGDLLPIFIFLTAKVENQDIRHGMQLGADDYVIKPFSTADILVVIESNISKRNEIIDAVTAKERSRILRKTDINLQQLLSEAHDSFEKIKDKLTALDDSERATYLRALNSLEKAKKVVSGK